MKILVHFQFSFLLKIENNFTTHFFHFSFFKMKIFRFLFSNFWKKWNEVHFFSFPKNKQNRNFDFKFVLQFWKKNENWNFMNLFLILFRFFLLPLLLRWRPCARQDPDQPCLQRKQASRGQRISISRSSIARRH